MTYCRETRDKKNAVRVRVKAPLSATFYRPRKHPVARERLEQQQEQQQSYSRFQPT
jgi:hypothetical protein